MFFVGLLFAVGCMVLEPSLIQYLEIYGKYFKEGIMQTATAVVVIYYTGFLIDRFSSLVVEKALKNKNKKKTRNFLSQKIQMNWRHYEDYQKAEKHSSHIKTLSREYTFSRNSMTLFLWLTVLAILKGDWVFCSVTWFVTIFLYFSTKKHADKISQRVDFYRNHKD
jgi:hypothetical protein